MASVQLRLLKFIGETSFWKRTGRLHAWLYRRTGGKIGHKAGNLTNLLLTTRGRTSGQPRTVPLTYMRDGEHYVLVASNGGSDRHPSWWLNLRKSPQAEIQVGDRRIAVVAARAGAPERARLWPQLKAINPFYGHYEQITDREIPVVILRPSPEKAVSPA
ncbi:MAG: nitroreductase family deazaflavin-dependent oxidoreductase [Candidatus Binatia bacterium]